MISRNAEVQKRRAVAEDFWRFACSVQRVWTLFEGEARKITPAASSPPPCVLSPWPVLPV